jgi:2-keto-4-pentenoate hydratase
MPQNDFVDQTGLREAADALWDARSTHRPIPPLRQWLDATNLRGAYAVQRLNTARRLSAGRRMIGRKIGLTSAAVQRQLGVDRPDFGILFDDMLYEGDEVRISTAGLLQPRIEGEIAFILDEDVTETKLPRNRLLRAAGSAAAAFEIVDSAIADWKITLADTVADNASCGAVVLARDRKPLASVDVRLAGMVMTEDNTIVSLGVGAASLGDPITAFGWLADLAIEQNEPLRRGEIVLTGALGAMVPFARGKRYRLEIAGFAPLIANAD